MQEITLITFKMRPELRTFVYLLGTTCDQYFDPHFLYRNYKLYCGGGGRDYAVYLVPV
jgi:hypothetical protein